LLPIPAWFQGRGDRPEGYCHRVMLDAVRYVVDNGVKWANLPADFPPYRRVHAFARRWQVTGLLAELHDRLRDKVREKEGRTVDPTAAIVDSQSVRAAANIPRSTSGWDGGKKVGGRKRHLVVDCLGLVLAVVVTAASVQDRDACVRYYPTGPRAGQSMPDSPVVVRYADDLVAICHTAKRLSRSRHGLPHGSRRGGWSSTRTNHASSTRRPGSISSGSTCAAIHAAASS
jgi:transposase